MFLARVCVCVCVCVCRCVCGCLGVLLDNTISAHPTTKQNRFQLLKCKCEKDAFAIIRSLSTKLGNIDAAVDIQKQTLLHLAVVYANPFVVGALLSEGANVAAKDG